MPGGDIIANHSIKHFSMAAFQTRGSLGYMGLLLLPFVVAPVVAGFTRWAIGSYIASSTRKLAELAARDFTIIAALLIGYVAYSFWRTGAVSLLQRGTDFRSAVADRFDLLESLGFIPQMALKSLLIFLACYAFVRALRERRLFWIIAANVSFLVLTVLLILLNMKWPLLLYYSTLTVAVFFHAKRRPYLGASTAATLTLLAYVVVSASLLRVHSMDAMQPSQKSEVPLPPPQGTRASDPIKYIVSGSTQHWPYLLAALLNRMALPYPFYFETFSQEGSICGTILDRIERKTNPCHPSTLIYDRMFKDEFSGRGTAPQAVHISGYALNGWLGALIELTLASIVIGCFISIPSTATSTAATLSLMGGLTGYYFSQLPFEGPIIYDHGIAWFLLLVACYATMRRIAVPGSNRTSDKQHY